VANERLKFDVGIVIPLREEYRYVVELAAQLESISHEGTYFYRLDFGAISTVCCLVDQMGPLPALQTATRLLGFTDLKLLVVLGLGGALDDDIAVGDVVIAAEVNEFQANSKAQSADAGYEVRYSGRHWPLEFRIREAISHFEFSGHEAFARWQADTSADYGKLEIPGKQSVCSSPPSLRLGPIASGSVVAASSAFIAEVKRINRKFVAIDMEAAGVAPAAAERIHPIPCLIVRGISDHANERKKDLDAQGRGTWRRYCVRNATSLLRHLLTWDGFLSAAGLDTSRPPSRGEDLARKLVMRLKSCVGGPWIVGVAFGIYSHGPWLEGGVKAVPMDLNRLRVSDARVGGLLDSADKLKEGLVAFGDLQAGVSGFASLMETFRNQLNSPDANSLLQEFDRVIREILCPDNKDEEVESLLLESDRLEELAGPQAVVEFLKGLGRAKPRLRERYVDALASANMWPDVVDTLRHVEHAQLSRRELEHAIFACAKTGLLDCATEMMKRHRNEFVDNAARVFRREVSLQHPEIGREASGGNR
jgi:nucleoside phosphorylase